MFATTATPAPRPALLLRARPESFAWWYESAAPRSIIDDLRFCDRLRRAPPAVWLRLRLRPPVVWCSLAPGVTTRANSAPPGMVLSLP